MLEALGAARAGHIATVHVLLDPVHAWHESMFDLHGGYARRDRSQRV